MRCGRCRRRCARRRRRRMAGTGGWPRMAWSCARRAGPGCATVHGAPGAAEWPCRPGPGRELAPSLRSLTCSRTGNKLAVLLVPRVRSQARKGDGDEQPVRAHPGRWRCRGPGGRPGSHHGLGRGHREDLDRPARRCRPREGRPVHRQRHHDRRGDNVRPLVWLPVDRQRHAQERQRAARLHCRLAVRRQLRSLRRRGRPTYSRCGPVACPGT